MLVEAVTTEERSHGCRLAAEPKLIVVETVVGVQMLDLRTEVCLGLQRLASWVHSGQGWGLIGPSMASSRNRLPPPRISRRPKRHQGLSRLRRPPTVVLANGENSRLTLPSYSGASCWSFIPRRDLL
jgi:hypothetical protein